MKKAFIYIISVVIGLLIGVLIYHIVMNGKEKEEFNDVDYITYEEILDNLSYFTFEYGVNINKNYSYNKFIEPIFNTDILLSYFKRQDECLFNISCGKNIKDVVIPTNVIKEALDYVYGPDTDFLFKDFDYEYKDFKGTCIYKPDQKVFSCEINYIKTTESNNPHFEYDIYKMDYVDENTIKIKAFQYFIDYNCEGENNVCLYNDIYKKDFITKCRKDEIDDYKNHFNEFEIIYEKNSNNKYYLRSLNW